MPMSTSPAQKRVSPTTSEKFFTRGETEQQYSPGFARQSSAIKRAGVTEVSANMTPVTARRSCNYREIKRLRNLLTALVRAGNACSA